MYIDGGIAWHIFFALIPNAFTFITNISIVVISILIGYVLFLVRNDVRYPILKLLATGTLCFAFIPYVAHVICLIGAIMFDMASEFPLTGFDAVINYIYGLFCILFSITLTYCGGYYLFFRKSIREKKNGKRFFLFCAALSGGNLLPLYVLYRYIYIT